MADEYNSHNAAAAPAVRMVKCVKLGRELPGLDRAPWKGAIGQRVFENVSKEAWKGWVEPARSELAEDHGRADGAVFLRRRRESSGRLRPAEALVCPRRASQRNTPQNRKFVELAVR
jgi:hypothetical protein